MRILLSITFVLIASLSNAQSWKSEKEIPDKFTFPVVVELNGKIHIMGGGGTSGATTLHYQYDPKTDEWTAKAKIPYATQQPAGAALDGKIHFFGGGFPNSGSPVDSHFIYDAKTDSWSRGAALSAPRAIHDAVALDGKLYSMGGQGMKDLFEVYDPKTDRWSKLSNLPDRNFWYGAHAVLGGKIYRFCGGGYQSPVKSCHVYDPSTDKWTALPDFPVSVHAMSATPIGNVIYLTGGYYDFDQQPDVWAFDPSNNTYTAMKEMPDGRNYHRSVSIGDCLYVLGGSNQVIENMNIRMDSWCPWSLNVGEEAKTKMEVSFLRHSNQLTISGANAKEELNVSVYDLDGRELYRSTTTCNETASCSILLKDAMPKLFMVNVQRPDGTYLSKKISNP